MRQLVSESRARRSSIPAALVMVLAVLGFGLPCRGQMERGVNAMANAYTDGDWQQALKFFQQVVRKSPKIGPAWYNMGICLMTLRRYQEALEAFQRAAVILNDHSSQYEIAVVLVALGRRAEAVPYYQKALAMSPDFSPYSADLGRTLYELGRYDEAIPVLERYIRDRGQDRNSNYGEAFEVDLLESYAATGKFREASVLLGRRRSVGMGVKMQADGLLVERVGKNMPADRAGIRPGDVLLSWKGMPLAGLRPPRFDEVVQAVAAGDRVPVELNRGGQLQKVELLMGFLPDTARAPVAGPPSLKIQLLEIHPPRMAAGAPFEVTVDYVATDPAAGTGAIAVEFSFQVLSGTTVLFTQPAVKTEGPNGSVRRRVERLVAAPSQGRYVFRASLRYGSSVVEESAGFEVQ